MKTFFDIAIIVAGLVLFSSCEKDITLDLPVTENKIVVEGHIEPGQPTYVILTKNVSFFTATPTDLNDIFVHDAVVTVSDGNNSYTLDELCLNDLPPAIRSEVYRFLGLPENGSGTAALNVCAYVSFTLTGEYGKKYALNVETPDASISAVTSIPYPAPIDSMWTIPDEELGDSLVVLWLEFKEPDTLGNYYRYYTKVNNEPFYPGYFGSVLSDEFSNGSKFKVNVDRGYPRTGDIDFSTYGLFAKGDTVILKLSMIDRAHYRFWNTIEDQLLSGGPISTPTYIQSNINGGLGIWGGYGPSFDTIIVPK